MARMATYSGVQVTWDKALNSQHRLGPETCTWESEPPVLPGDDGTESKRYETELACQDGAVEIDMVIRAG